MDNKLQEYQKDLSTLKQKISHVQVKLEASTEHVKALRNTLNEMGYSSLDDAKEAYKKMYADAEKKHAQVKQLIQEIDNLEAKMPSREEILSKLKGELLNTQTSNISESLKGEEVGISSIEMPSFDNKLDEKSDNKKESLVDADLSELLFGGLK